MKSRLYLLFFLFLVHHISLSAQLRDMKVAREIASAHLATTKTNIAEICPKAKSLQNVLHSNADSDCPFYIFNNKEKASFVIISGDSRMKTVLGYSDNTSFSSEAIPCGLAMLLSHYASQYAYLNEIGIAGKTSERGDYSTTYNDVEPLLTSAWGQDSPFNDNCPVGCPCGCVATAMAQIMRYYKYPETGKGSFSYVSRTNRYQRSFDFGNTRFNWDEMQDRYAPTGMKNSSMRAAAASLAEACGVSVGMDYTRSGSGAYDLDIAYALIHFFSYNENIALYERSYFKSAEWYDKVHEELEAGRPILYCGQDRMNNGGHAFVIDGFRNSDGKFHVNWGWNGDYDSYYELDALNPSNYRFSTGQSMIARFTPQITGEKEDIFFAEAFSHSGTITLNRKLEFTLTGAVNFSSASSYVVTTSSFSGKIGVGLFDAEKHFIHSLNETKVNGIRSGYGPSNSLRFSFTIDTTGLANNAIYYIMPYAQATSSEQPTRIRTSGGLSDYYVLKLGKPDDNDPDEEPDPMPDGELLLTEYFNDYGLPDKWRQTNILGAGIWKTLQILGGGDDTAETPTPASGRGYAYLKYNSGTAFADIRTVTRLETPILYGDEGQQYELVVDCRKFSEVVNTNAIVTILIDKGCRDSWEPLTELNITNSNSWQHIQHPFTCDGPYRLGLEGSIENGTSIFLDAVKILKVDGAQNVNNLSAPKNLNKNYSVNGYEVSAPTKGINVSTERRGRVKKVIYK